MKFEFLNVINCKCVCFWQFSWKWKPGSRHTPNTSGVIWYLLTTRIQAHLLKVYNRHNFLSHYQLIGVSFGNVMFFFVPSWHIKISSSISVELLHRCKFNVKEHYLQLNKFLQFNKSNQIIQRDLFNIIRWSSSSSLLIQSLYWIDAFSNVIEYIRRYFIIVRVSLENRWVIDLNRSRYRRVNMESSQLQ